MPQLDLYSIGNQFFWGFIFFALFYYFATYYVIPSIFSIMFARAFYVSKINTDAITVVSFCFVFTSLSFYYYSDFFVTTASTLDNLYINKFSYVVALDEFFLIELNEIYDSTYFNDDEK